MGNQILHRLTVPEDAVTDENTRTRRELALQNTLGEAQSSAFSLSTDPGERVLAGQYRAKYSRKMAEEIEGLFAAQGIDHVVLYDDDNIQRDDGYYSLEDIDVTQVGRPGQNVNDFQGVLRRSGSKQNYFRGVRTTTGSQADHPFGSTTTAAVGVDANASKVAWLNSDGSREVPTTLATVTTEFGDVDLYDAEASTYDDPTLIYELDYEREGQTDAKVWDERDNGLSGKLDGDGYVQWQRVFEADYDFKGHAVLTNCRIRAMFDEETNSITVEEYTSGSWSSVSLTSNDWQIYDLDVYHIGMSRVDGQAVFQNTSSGDLYHLEFSLKRGWENFLWHIPANESPPIPSGLQDLVDNIASPRIYDPREKVTIVERSDFRK